MIIADNNYIIKGVGTFRRTISDTGLTIRKVGTDEVYSEAIDVLTSTATYEETSTPTEAETITGDELVTMLEVVL